MKLYTLNNKAIVGGDGKAIASTDGTITLIENGTHNVSNYANAIVNVDNPAPCVLFRDYDNSTIATWPMNEVSIKTDLPTIPTHSGLTSTNWTMTLADIKTWAALNPTSVIRVNPGYTVNRTYKHNITFNWGAEYGAYWFDGYAITSITDNDATPYNVTRLREYLRTHTLSASGSKQWSGGELQTISLSNHSRDDYITIRTYRTVGGYTSDVSVKVSNISSFNDNVIDITIPTE